MSTRTFNIWMTRSQGVDRYWEQEPKAKHVGGFPQTHTDPACEAYIDFYGEGEIDGDLDLIWDDLEALQVDEGEVAQIEVTVKVINPPGAPYIEPDTSAQDDARYDAIRDGMITDEGNAVIAQRRGKRRT